MKTKKIEFAPKEKYNPFAFVVTGKELTAEQMELQNLSKEVYELRAFIYENVDKKVMQRIGKRLESFSIEQLRYFYNQLF